MLKSEKQCRRYALAIETFLVIFCLCPILTSAENLEYGKINGAVGDGETFVVDSNFTVHVKTDFDILLPIQQYKAAYGNRNRNKRKVQHAIFFWPYAVVDYEAVPNLPMSTIESIVRATRDLTNYTCIQMNKKPSVDIGIRYTTTDNNPSSLVGYQGNKQDVFLNTNYISKAVVIHETFHALGVWHENQRPDRDKYIKLNNIPPIYENNFKIPLGTLTLGVKYDYLSVMHYQSYGGLIQTLDPRYQDKIGQNIGLSFYDIVTLNLMYGCASHFGNCGFKECPFNGFVFFKAFNSQPSCTCFCDSGDLNDPLVPCSSITEEANVYNLSLGAQASTNAEPVCINLSPNCESLKGQHQCSIEPGLMRIQCAKTCGFCEKMDNVCLDYSNSCDAMTSLCDDPDMIDLMSIKCPKTCKICLADIPCDIE